MKKYHSLQEIFEINSKMLFSDLKPGYSFRLPKYDGEGYLLVDAVKIDERTYLDEETKVYHSAEYVSSTLGWTVYGPFLDKSESNEFAQTSASC
jgi:hypothetical protein